MSSDGSRLYFAADCSSDPHDACVVAVAPDGTARVERDLGPERGSAICSLWPSDDGAHLAFVTGDWCSDLWTIDPALSSAPRKLAALVPHDVWGSPEGIDPVAWSPDGRSLALVSMHEGPGCGGGEGVSNCSGMLFVADATTGVVRRVSARYLHGRALVWTY
jgi:hypothetical protein